MGAGLAVLAADLPPMRRVLEEVGAGVLYSVGSTQALAEQVVSLLRDPDRCHTLGARGREAVVGKYHWGRDEATFVGAVAGVSRHAVSVTDLLSRGHS